jgi:hypothetical protein
MRPLAAATLLGSPCADEYWIPAATTEPTTTTPIPTAKRLITGLTYFLTRHSIAEGLPEPGQQVALFISPSQFLGCTCPLGHLTSSIVGPAIAGAGRAIIMPVTSTSPRIPIVSMRLCIILANYTVVCLLDQALPGYLTYICDRNNLSSSFSAVFVL